MGPELAVRRDSSCTSLKRPNKAETGLGDACDLVLKEWDFGSLEPIAAIGGIGPNLHIVSLWK